MASRMPLSAFSIFSVPNSLLGLICTTTMTSEFSFGVGASSDNAFSASSLQTLLVVRISLISPPSSSSSPSNRSHLRHAGAARLVPLLSSNTDGAHPPSLTINNRQNPLPHRLSHVGSSSSFPIASLKYFCAASCTHIAAFEMFLHPTGSPTAMFPSLNNPTLNPIVG